MKDAPKTIWKIEQFEAFLNILEQGVASHWVDIARAIGVEEDTITVWKRRPEAQEAISKGITHALMEMETAGKRDWRMWESKLKMLGVSPIAKVELSNPIGEILGKYGLDDAGQTQETKS